MRSIQVVALERTCPTGGTAGTIVLQERETTLFKGSFWRVERCGSLTVFAEKPEGGNQPVVTFAAGRWLEIFFVEDV